MKRKTTEEFKKELYDKFPHLTVIGEYKGGKKTIYVQGTCGHTWNAIPQKLISLSQKSTCSICIGNITRRSSESFKNEISSKFPNLILIDNYITSTTKLQVSCQLGHKWYITPNSLLNKQVGSKCSICNPKIIYNKKSNEQFLEEVNNLNLGITVLDPYRDSNSNIQIKCRNGHTYTVTPNILLNRGWGCSKCTSEIQEEKYIKTVEEKFPHISITSKYEGSKEYINIKCERGHEWSTLAGNLLYYGAGSTCYICNPRDCSRAEVEIVDFIKSIYPGWVEQHDRSILDGYELDIVLPDVGLAFEFNGTYWHSDKFKDKYYHKDKTDKVSNFGYQLIHINEDEWIKRKDIVKSRIRSLLKNTYKLYARQCIVKEIEYPREFLEINHLQGSGSPTSINLGLFLKDVLVAVMTFSTPRFNKEYTYELVRYSSLLDINVIGGASKLLKYFRNKWSGSIISYSDRRWSIGKMYSTLGFEYLHTSEPNYRYYKYNSSLSRYGCQKHLLKEKFPKSYSDDLTEKEIMQLEGYYPVYDSGNDVWILK